MTEEGHERELTGKILVSREMRLRQVVLLSVSVTVGLGVFALGEPIVAVAGTRTPLSFIVGGVLALCTVLSYAELTASTPGSGSYVIVSRIQGGFLAFLTGWILILSGMAACAVVALSTGRYLFTLIQPYVPLALPYHLVALILVALVTGVHAVEARQTRRLRPLLVWLVLIFLILFSLLALPKVDPRHYRLLATDNLIAALILVWASFWGMEVVVASRDEIRYPRQTVPRALLLALILSTFLSTLIMAIGLGLLGSQALAAPSALVLMADRVFGFFRPPLLTIVAALSTLVVLSWLPLAIVRQLYAMSRDGFLPPLLTATHRRFKTPHTAVFATGLGIMLLIAVGQPATIARLSGLGLLLVGGVINATAIVARYRRPAGKRPFQLPFHPLIPGLGIAINLLIMFTIPWSVLFWGTAWIVTGLLVYRFYAHSHYLAAQEGVTIFKEDLFEEQPPAAYRVLVPVANPTTAGNLIHVAATLARSREGEVVALQVITVPEPLSMTASRGLTWRRMELLEKAVRLGEEAEVSIHPVTRLARTVARGILDTANEADCNVIVLGWHGNTRPPGTSLGVVIDTVIQEALCNVIVVKGGDLEGVRSILVPTAGGPHASVAVELALQIAQVQGARVTALNLCSPHATPQDVEEARQRIQQSLLELSGDQPVELKIVRADDVVEGILAEAENHDMIMIGATEETLLDRFVFGAVPLQIAARCSKPVIMVRGYQGLARFWLRKLWQSLFDLFPTVEEGERLDVYRQLRRGARPNVNYFILTVLSCIIATLGLLQNSAAVIIGAMLVAPLMTPILALALGVVHGDVRLLRLSIESALKGIALAIVVSTVMTIVSPLSPLTAEVLARTRPTLLDLIIALASGAAGAYAVSRKEVAAALPGVAIAAALMPPLCTVGVGLGTNRPEVAGGAMLLFTTNLISICLAGAVIFLLLGFRPSPGERIRRLHLRQGLAVTLILLVVIAIPLAVIMARTVADSRRRQAIERSLSGEVAGLGTLSLVEFSYVDRGEFVEVMATVYTQQTVTEEMVDRLREEVARGVGKPVHLRLLAIPVAEVDSQ